MRNLIACQFQLNLLKFSHIFTLQIIILNSFTNQGLNSPLLKKSFSIAIIMTFDVYCSQKKFFNAH